MRQRNGARRWVVGIGLYDAIELMRKIFADGGHVSAICPK